MEYFSLDTILPLGLSAFGGFVALYSSWQIRRGKASKNWPTSAGTVLSSGVRRSESTDWNEDDDPSAGRTTDIKFIPSVKYTYQVEGEAYPGDKMGLYELSFGNRMDAINIANKYPEGSIVTVFYDPRKPSFGLLETGAHWLSYLFVLFGLFFVIFGLVLGKFIPSPVLWFSGI